MFSGKINFIVSILSVWIALPATQVAARPHRELAFANLSVRDGLSHVHVFDIRQDRQGFMWFATGDGLNRYDGYQFVEYKHDPADSMSLSHNVVLSIVEDDDRHLWIGTAKGINRIDLVTGEMKRYGEVTGYIRSLCVDPTGHLWIYSGNRIYRHDTRTDRFSRQSFGHALDDTGISAIMRDRGGDIWVATDSKGLLRFDPQTMAFRTYRSAGANTLISDKTSALFEDSQRRIWIGTRNRGVCYYDPAEDRFVEVATAVGHSDKSVHIRSFGEDDRGNLWIGTLDGLIVRYAEGTAKRFAHSDKDTGSLSHNSVFCIFRDKVGSMWLGTYGGGVDFYNPILDQFKVHEPPKAHERGFGHVGPMVERDDKLWIGTEGAGLVCYDMKSETYGYYDSYGAKTLRNDGIRALCFDDEGILWVGTNTLGVMRFDPARRRFVGHDGGPGQVNDIYKDTNGNIWMGITGPNGLLVKEPGSGRFRPVVNSGAGDDTVNYESIRPILELNNGDLWVGSIDHGIFVFRDGRFLRRISTRNSGMTCDFISFLKEDSRRRIWICTHGGGVNIYHPEEDRFECLSTKNGLPNDNVCWVTEDDRNNFWISTMGGLSCYNDTDRSTTGYTYRRGNFPLEILSLKSGLQVYASNNRIYIGGNGKIASFAPLGILRDMQPPEVALTGLMLHNLPVLPGDKTAILDKTTEQTPTITLRHNQTDITLQFAALNYIYPHNNLYSYKLEGYDKEWVNPTYQRSATYTNLPAGNYTFRVRACNSSGIWNQQGTALDVEVLLPPWKKWWAWVIYVALAGGMVYLMLSYRLSKLRMKNDIDMKQLEKQTIESNHRMRIALFTNFSHELRTPLTLILDPLKNILSDRDLPAKFNKPLNLIQTNAEKILLLVNQLMDLRKSESGKMNLNVREGDIVHFINGVLVFFRELVAPRHIRIRIDAPQDEIALWFDPFLMEKVFFNILSNAVKNTPDNGAIHISVEVSPENRRLEPRDSPCLYIVVSDTGIGIPEEDIERIFEPFFQVNSRKKPRPYGTGVGLHLTKTIVALHHGEIWAESVCGNGASFHIELPMDPAVYSEEERMEASSGNAAISDRNAGTVANEIPSDESKKRAGSTILVVDDNKDMRSYIREVLQAEYEICEATNGEEALAMIREVPPELIVSDIMMPVKDGLELARELKAGAGTSHIPIILLTAKSTVNQIEEGLGSGADDYITKPFHGDLLRAKIHTIIANRRLLKETFVKSFSVDLPDKIISNKDELFLSSAYEFVRNNINNNKLNVDLFSKAMHLERSRLYRKLKTLTNMSPSMFLSTMRLKVAAELLVSTDMSVSEVAYKVGFESASYFTTRFKRLYGTSPTGYASAKRNP